MFNLTKHAQGALDGAVQGLGSGIDEATELVGPDTSELQTDDVTQGLSPEQEAVVMDSAQQQSWDRVMSQIQQMPPEVMGALERTPDFQDWQAKISNASNSLTGDIEELGLEGADLAVGQTGDLLNLETSVVSRAMALQRAIQEGLAQQELVQQQVAFNLKEHKVAQMPAAPMGMPEQAAPVGVPEPVGLPEEEVGRFPVANEGDFLAKFVDDLLGFDSAQPGTPQYERARQAAEEIRDAVSPGFEEEANSILESVMQLDAVTQRNEAADYLLKLYEVLLPPMAKEQQPMEPVMSENVEGIIQHSLSDSILNNKTAQDAKGLTKTAADQFGQQYLLYGPTEKRICPKLRGKQGSVGDVVSEYTCRHHCIDGIVIDDNKTICGEALWRANSMDKQSSEYVDADGNIKGGYIEKRFQVDHNVPEENQRRLKPGETRKPKPAAWGSTEARLQDMRSKEGQSRGFGPDSNTGTPFNWAKDVDQNNVEVDQAERNRREEASGHKLVQYTNRTEGENDKTKKAFNMKDHKTAQITSAPTMLLDDFTTPTKPKKGKHSRDTSQPHVNPVAAGSRRPAEFTQMQTVDNGKPMAKKKKSFNMNDHKIAETPHPGPAAVNLDIEFNDQGEPRDTNTPKTKPTKKKS